MSEKIDTYSPGDEARYWSDFYERNDFSSGSTFFEYLDGFPGLPNTVVDIGCGQGRDSFAFASTGRYVLGLDRSVTGIEHASNKSVSGMPEGNLSFAVCDVADYHALAERLIEFREQTVDSSICYYMRFFLHSIPEDVQETLLSTIADQARPGDIFAAEFRTDKDEDHTRVFGDTHYRRFQNADDFSKKLQDEYGWVISFETEGRGLSPYGDEDPILYRVVAAMPPRE